MMRAAAVILVCVSAALKCQPVSPPRFEVASIRLSNPDEMHGPSGMQTGRGLVRALNVTLTRAIAGAYGIQENRILGGPEWIDSDRFQMTAKADQPFGEDVLNVMLQTLLAERFNLKLHRESRPGETVILEVAKNGPKLQPATGVERPSYSNGHGHLDATSVTMSEFAKILSRDLNLPVVDRTTLSGAFRFALYYDADRPNTANPEDAAADLRVEMSKEMTQQLGLRLRAERVPVEVLVIDHVEKPSEN